MPSKPTFDNQKNAFSFESLTFFDVNSAGRSTLSITDLHGSRVGSWKTKPIFGFLLFRYSIDPDVGWIKFDASLKRVDLPAPDEPKIETKLSFSISKFMGPRIGVSYCL